MTHKAINMKSDTNILNDTNLPSMGVYCKGCGLIIYAVTIRHLKNDEDARKEIAWYRGNGYVIEEMDAKKVRKYFGCKCKAK